MTGVTGMNVSLLPPTNATDDVSDEDSGDENTTTADNWPASQLNAPAVAPWNYHKCYFPILCYLIDLSKQNAW